MMTDPERILSGYEGKLAEAQRKSEAIREALTGLRVTERSSDGQITVTINDAGNLVDLHLGNSLQRKDGATVGQEVLRVVQAAQSRVAAAVQEVMAPVLGGDSEAMHFMVDKLRSAQPPPPPAYVPGHGGWGTGPQPLGAIEDDAPPPGPRAPQPPPRRRAPQDDEDFGDRGFLR
ncbi:YbaB/EbfC family nucleoid-associated protein [Saccharothrix longispora]|uniref:YbaB/EbfC family nucleoid-associated protein n=1 Tax=Saccharothrix longispora TaxID=33920 RepID=UPI0028FD01B2|nr:YbaB/EbfC family nucleoid-associated protein [Saccharothrix longispora]MDU0294837.1 YbaB/EbfC family nucleoid-associated protein [Saccharothrix longispora]